MAEVEVWPEYPLPQFLELRGSRRVAALSEARNFRTEWVAGRSWRRRVRQQPFFDRAGLRRRRAAARAKAATAAASRLAESREYDFWVIAVFNERASEKSYMCFVLSGFPHTAAASYQERMRNFEEVC